jgi:hypothetical protein
VRLWEMGAGASCGPRLRPCLGGRARGMLFFAAVPFPPCWRCFACPVFLLAVAVPAKSQLGFCADPAARPALSWPARPVQSAAHGPRRALPAARPLFWRAAARLPLVPIPGLHAHVCTGSVTQLSTQQLTRAAAPLLQAGPSPVNSGRQQLVGYIW